MSLKLILEKLLYFLIPASLITIIIGNFMVIGHMAVHNIGLAVMGACVIADACIHRTLKFYIPLGHILPWACILLLYVIQILLHDETAHDIKYFLGFKTVWAGYAFTLALLPFQSKKIYFLLFKIFILTCFCISVFVIYKYIYLIVIGHGDAYIHPTWRNFIDMLYPFIIPFKIVHHTLGLFSILSVYFLYYLLKEEEKSSFMSLFYRVLMVFFVLFIHFISSRLIIGILYTGIIIVLFNSYKENKISVRSLVLATASLILLLFTAYLTIPTFKNKINFTVLNKIEPNEIVVTETHYKNLRLISHKVGLEATKKYFWTGTGFGKENTIFEDLNKKYFEDPDLWKLRPHNQFLYNTATMGVPLALVFILLFYSPLVFIKNKIQQPLTLLFICISAYFFTDCALQLKQFFVFIAFWVPFLLHFYLSLTVDKGNA